MDIYLPIAEMSVNLFLLLGLGGAVGFLSGVFGVGGGFLMTPLLIFIGIPPPVAVGSEASQILASSSSGVLAHMRRGNVDVRMGMVLVAGGFVGSGFGVWLFAAVAPGRPDRPRDLALLRDLPRHGRRHHAGRVGGAAGFAAARAPAPSPSGIGICGCMACRSRSGSTARGSTSARSHRLALGFFVGILASIMGVGGGFLMVPAMIYLLGMPTAVVVGTSLLQIAFVTAVTTYLHAVNNFTVDVVLALALIVGGVIGAQLGSNAGARLRGEQLRILLGLLVLGVCVKLGHDLIASPADLYSLATAGHP